MSKEQLALIATRLKELEQLNKFNDILYIALNGEGLDASRTIKHVIFLRDLFHMFTSLQHFVVPDIINTLDIQDNGSIGSLKEYKNYKDELQVTTEKFNRYFKTIKSSLDEIIEHLGTSSTTTLQ